MQRTHGVPAPHKLKSPVNLFFKFQRIICFHLTSQYFSRAESLFRFYGRLKESKLLVLEKMIQ